ncbi:hypothetical protein [Asanoa siamensis]|uniref:hypothetical protein n=1 Tax=Asanoa siamensis TaxID=926357 RepID=UPI001944A658|nr:hypothetical protein [Asanoa siamensis]
MYLIISQAMGSSPWDQVEVKDNDAYNLTERYLPLINLAVWTACAALYFRRPQAVTTNAALRLGFFWLALAVLADWIGFVVLEHPLAVDAEGFYVAQAPWLYMTYAAVFVAPLLFRWRSKRKA